MTRFRTVTSLALVLTALAAANARAGTYDVFACNAAVAGGANNAFAASADPGLTAYTSCPAGEGIVARNAWDHGTSANGQAAYQIFDAPPTTQVSHVDFYAGWKRNDCTYAFGAWAVRGDGSSSLLFGESSNSGCGGGEIPSDTDFFPAVLSYDVNAPRLVFQVRCGGASGCSREGVTSMRIRDVRVTVQDDTPPSLANIRGGLAGGDWVSGTQAIGGDGSDFAGVRSSSVTVDGHQVTSRTYDCDVTQRVPCPTSVAVDESMATSGFADGEHAVALAVADLAGNVGTVTRTARIDNTAPGAPTDLAVVGGDGWRPNPSFDITWKLPEEKEYAPITGARWRLCKVDPTAPAGSEPAAGDCKDDHRDGDAISSLTDLKVPEPGQYTLKVWLVDKAGNADPRLSSGPVMLRFDDTSPQASFEAPDPADPTRISVATSDTGSGLASGTIAIRKVGATTWQAVPADVDGNRLVGHLDDEHLSDGTYELNATVADQAGNSKSTDAWTDGAPATVQLPLRLKTHLAVGIVRRVGKRTRRARAASVKYGQRVRITGRLTSKGGNPLQDVEVQCVTQVQDGHTAPRLLATVKTSRTGRFSFVVQRGPSRSIAIRYAGAPLIRTASARLTMNVKSTTSMRPDHRLRFNGQTVRFAGKISTGRLPGTGKLVEVQVYVRGEWRTFSTTRADRKGRWRLPYTFDGTRGTQRYRFRAAVPREAGYPFVSGVSRVVGVRVRGI